MQVGAGNPSGRTNLAYGCSCRNQLTFLAVDLTQVAVQANEALTMIDYDGVAVEEIITSCRDRASHRRNNSRSGAGRDIHAFMW